MADRWDDIVVGAGTAGCCVARRLADSGRRVLLLEAGPGAPVPAAVAGTDFLRALVEPGWTWPGLVAERTPSTTATPYPQGRGLGGSSAVNGLLAMVGDRQDYDRWERQLGCPGRGWTWVAAGLARARRRLALQLAAPGPLAVAVRAAAARAGHRIGGLSTEPGRYGLVTAALTAAGDVRWSAARAYLDGAPGGLEVRPHHEVARVVSTGRVAVGVELAGGAVLEASRVVVSAGAAHSASILAASGLSTLGLGAGVRDHPAVSLAVQPSKPTPPSGPVISHVLRWSSGVAGGRGDLLLVPMERVAPPGRGAPGAAVLVGLMRVRSTGTVLDDAGHRRLRLAMLAEEVDRQRLIAGLRAACRLLDDPALRRAGWAVTAPDGTSADELAGWSDDDLAGWLPRHLGPITHLAGGCRMGGGDVADRVVDLDGAVVGWRGLYVIDASVLPDLPGCTTHLPTLAVAEQLAAGLVADQTR